MTSASASAGWRVVLGIVKLIGTLRRKPAAKAANKPA